MFLLVRNSVFIVSYKRRYSFKVAPSNVIISFPKTDRKSFFVAWNVYAVAGLIAWVKVLLTFWFCPSPLACFHKFYVCFQPLGLKFCFSVSSKQKTNNPLCKLEKSNILRHFQVLGRLSDEALSSLGARFLLVYAKCYIGISLYTSQSYAAGFSIMFLILNHSLEMRAALF